MYELRKAVKGQYDARTVALCASRDDAEALGWAMAAQGHDMEIWVREDAMATAEFLVAIEGK